MSKFELKKKLVPKKKSSEFFKQLYAEAEKNPAYWAEGMSMEVTEELYKRMEEKGLNQSTLARLMDIDRTQVSRFFSGGENLTLLTICKIALALGMKPRVKLYEEKDEEE